MLSRAQFEDPNGDRPGPSFTSYQCPYPTCAVGSEVSTDPHADLQAMADRHVAQFHGGVRYRGPGAISVLNDIDQRRRSARDDEHDYR